VGGNYDTGSVTFDIIANVPFFATLSKEEKQGIARSNSRNEKGPM
jgi:hypothetical protein